MITFARRVVADRATPTSASWRSAADIDNGAIAAAMGIAPEAVAGVDVADVDHGTTQRSRLDVRLADGTATTLFVKNSPLRLGPKVLDAVARLCEREATFYRLVAPLVPGAPRALLAEWDGRTGRSTIVMCDLRDDGFEFRPASEPCTPHQVGLALTALADLHASSVSQRPRIGGVDDLFVLDGPSMTRLSHTVCRVVGRGPRSLRALVPDHVLGRARILAAHPRRYAARLASLPQVFIHNDTHRGNIGFSDDSAVLIDWQNCGSGPGMKDVAYLMATSLEPVDRRACERDLVDGYRARLHDSGGPAMTHDDAWDAYRFLAISAYLAAAVTAMFRNRLQAAANAEESLRRAAATVDDLDSFATLAWDGSAP